MWQIEISIDAGLALSKLNAETQLQILDDLHNYIKPLLGKRTGSPHFKSHGGALWRFRINNHSILCRVEELKKIIEIIEISPVDDFM